MPTEMTTVQPLPDPIAIGLVVVGIFVSILLPVAIRTLKKASASLEKAGGPPLPTLVQRFKAALAHYLGRGMHAAGYVLAAVFIAGVIIYFLGMQFYKNARCLAGRIRVGIVREQAVP